MERNSYHDLIDDYLSGKMSAGDRLSFEEGVGRDPLLKQEVALQQSVISTIQQQRKAQLKARLNNIQVSPVSGGMSLGWRIAAGVVVATTFISVAYLALENKFDTSSTTVAPIEYKVPAPSAEYGAESETITEEKNITTPKNLTVEVTPPTYNNDTKEDTKKVVKKKQATSEETQPKHLPVTQFDMPQGLVSDQDIHTESNSAAPNGNISSSENLKNSGVEVALDPKTEYKFHYKYYNNKLYLLCDFANKPYELIELNTKNVHSLYLYFDNQYYELKPNQSDVTPLKVIKKSDTIAQLEKIRNVK